MRNSMKLLMAALAALLLLSLAAGTAAALRSISVSPSGANEARSTALTFTESGGGFQIVCEVTLTMTLNASIAKRSGSSVGSTLARAANCRGGNVVVLTANQPWPITYVSFTGTLPNITSVRLEIRRAEFLVEAFFGIARCLFSGSAQGTTSGNPVTSINADETVALPLASEALSGASCPASGIFRGSFRVARSVSLRLI